MSFTIEDRVRWGSQASGHYRLKVGTVVAVIPAGQDTRAVHDQIRKLNQEHNCTQSQFGFGNARDHESYLILVDYPGTKKRPKIYWPRVSQLKAGTPEPVR